MKVSPSGSSRGRLGVQKGGKNKKLRKDVSGLSPRNTVGWVLGRSCHGRFSRNPQMQEGLSRGTEVGSRRLEKTGIALEEKDT